jgi:DNA repair exonuclease SbcCD ATPase subunit
MALTQAEIDALRKNYNPLKGPQSVDEWIYLTGDSLNVMNNLAVANARLANAIATALNEQKEVVQEVADMIDAVSTLKNDISVFKSTKSNLDETSKLGTSAEDARKLYNRLVALVGSLPTALQADIDKAFKDGNGWPSLSINTFQQIDAALQTRSQSLSSTSSQESLRLQTLTSRYTQANEQATTVQQKDAQNKTNVTNNLRGSG